MRNSFEKAVLRSIRQGELIPPGTTVVVAVSGGRDSVALLSALQRLKNGWEMNLRAAHFNHRLRGAASDADEQFVEHLCEELSLPLDRGRADQSRESSIPEASLRKERYRFLLETASAVSGRLATAHTLDDQAETVLLRLFRGAGLRGLGGIRPKSRAPDLTVIIRPLLEVSRDQVTAYLRSLGRDFREDVSNRDIAFDRNWLRHELLPMVRNRLNPQVIAALGRTARLSQDATRLIESRARKWLRMRGSRRKGALVLPVKAFRSIPRALMREVVRLAMREVAETPRMLSLKQVEAVIDLARGGSGREVHLPGGVRAARESEEIVFSAHE